MQPTMRISCYTLGLGAFNKVHRGPHLELHLLMYEREP